MTYPLIPPSILTEEGITAKIEYAPDSYLIHLLNLIVE